MSLFKGATASAVLGRGFHPLLAQDTVRPSASTDSRVSFFVIGDTHFLAREDTPSELDEVSLRTNTQLVATLNRLAGTEIPQEAGGGIVHSPAGLIHAGDLIDTGDKTSPNHLKMQQTEWDGFERTFGLNGQSGVLKMPVFEVHGNHDSPKGVGLVIDALRQRNQQRIGVVNRSNNGVHYSWNWGPVHCVNLGLSVGRGERSSPRRQFAPLESLDFLIGDLEQHVGNSGRPVVLTHHLNIAPYSSPCNVAEAPKSPKPWDSCDVHAYYEAISKYRIAGIFFGHTHARNIYRWDGTSQPSQVGLPAFNVDNGAHFKFDVQAMFYVEITSHETVIRELATTDRWEHSQWTNQTWRATWS